MEDAREIAALLELISLILKKWWLILLLTTLGFGSAYFLTIQFVTPIYEATTVLFIGKEDPGSEKVDISLGQLNADSQLIVDYQQIALTRLVIEKIIQDLDLPISYKQFRNLVVIETIQKSRLFTVGFQYSDPQIAKQVSDELASELSTAVHEIVGVENVRILDQAQVPKQPISPNIFKNAIIGGFLGLIASLTIIIMLFLFDDTIKTEDEIENLLGIPLMASIPETK